MRVKTNGKLSLQWDYDIAGNLVLLARKKRGKITVQELTEQLGRDDRFYGMFYGIIINANGDGGQCTGWIGEEEQKGDVLELYAMSDREDCPFCGRMIMQETCPECGAYLGGEGEN